MNKPVLVAISVLTMLHVDATLADELTQPPERIEIIGTRMRDGGGSPPGYHTSSAAKPQKNGPGPGAAGGAKAKPESESNTDAAEEESTCNPVLLATGEKHKTERDFSGANRHALSMARTYRSRSTSGFFFGANWTTNYDPITYSVS